jgi:hypothetical protein
MPWLLPPPSWILLPIWQFFLASQARLYAYGKCAFENYVAKHGRDSSRNDLLKRVLAGDKTEKPLTDRRSTPKLEAG